MEAIEMAKEQYACDAKGNKLLRIPEKDPIDCFMEILDEAIHDAKDELLERFEHICAQSPSAAKFMWENNTMTGYIPEEGIRSAMRHGTLVVG